MQNEPRPVDAEISPTMNMLASFDYLSNQLENLAERMEETDKGVYRTVGEFVDSTVSTVKAIVSEVADEKLNSSEPHKTFPISQADFSLLEQLTHRLCGLKQERDGLLLTAHTNEDIDRLMKLDYLCHEIDRRIQEIQKPIINPVRESEIQPTDPDSTFTREDLNRLTLAKLKEKARDQGLKGYTKLKKKELIDLILGEVSGEK